MTIKVYIWLPKASPTRVGHGSIELTNGTYISWWPQGGKGVNPKASGTPIRSLEQDIQDEGGDPNHTIELPRRVKLDEDAIQSWWDVAKHDKRWTVLTNCCWMVEEALKKGGLEKYLDMRRFRTISNPYQLLVLMHEIKAISVTTGRPLELITTAPRADEVIRSLLEGKMDTKILNSVYFK